MREILFRGKTEKGKWVYGAYYKQTHFYGDEENIDCIITTTDVLSNDLWLDYEEVIPETVGQFTGLTDKNGKKIFEGDIVKCDGEGVFDGILGCVVYEDGYFLVDYIKPVCDDLNGIAIGLLIDESNICCVEVIGDIYDNPELLKE